MEKNQKKNTKTVRFTNTIVWPPNYLIKINCPICRSREYVAIYPAYYPRVVRCKSCKLIYTNPRLKEKYLEQLYNQEYFQNENSSYFGYSNYLSDKTRIKQTFSKRLKDIHKLKKPGRLLDVGCAMGFFLDAASNLGWNIEGVEISDFAAKYAREELGYNVYVGDFQKVKIPIHCFDLVTMWDIIEHVPDPVGTLKKAHSLLKKDGLLVLTTPDVGSLPAMITRHRWVGYKLSDEHLMYFSKDTLSKLCEKAGLKIIRTHQVGKHVSFSKLVDRVGLYSNHVKNILEKLNKIIPADYSFYVSAFDIICVYAVKK